MKDLVYSFFVVSAMDYIRPLVAATLFQFFTGFFVYGPLFGTLYFDTLCKERKFWEPYGRKFHEKKEKEKGESRGAEKQIEEACGQSRMVKQMGMSLVLGFVKSYVLLNLFKHLDVTSYQDGGFVAFVLNAIFCIPLLIDHISYERQWYIPLIAMVYTSLSVIGMGVILATF
ncbi:hypothetical protein BKA69DRAFT_1100944 [Paraphysoderma sedebokerense]|nr:hypothetical protein BKA69DRAFT_1100944 [Paraphysoderma sedebokerense]